MLAVELIDDDDDDDDEGRTSLTAPAADMAAATAEPRASEEGIPVEDFEAMTAEGADRGAGACVKDDADDITAAAGAAAKPRPLTEARPARTMATPLPPPRIICWYCTPRAPPLPLLPLPLPLLLLLLAEASTVGAGGATDEEAGEGAVAVNEPVEEGSAAADVGTRRARSRTANVSLGPPAGDFSRCRAMARAASKQHHS